MIMNKSLKMLGFINRNTKEFINLLCLKNLFCSLVRSNHEYGSLIWYNHCSTYINNDFNSMQYKFLKKNCIFKSLSDF